MGVTHIKTYVAVSLVGRHHVHIGKLSAQVHCTTELGVMQDGQLEQ